MITRALDASTWPDFAALVERHNGVWGGCWCMGFHPEGVGRHKTPGANRGEKEARVRAGPAHAALVFEDDLCVGWCQFGPPTSCRGSSSSAPTWPALCRPAARLADHVLLRRQGPSPPGRLLRGARRRAGVDRAGSAVARSRAPPRLIGDRKVSGCFLHNGALEMFERHGFERVRQLGKHHWVVRTTV